MMAKTSRSARDGGARRWLVLDRLAWFCGGALCAGVAMTGPSWFESAQETLPGGRSSAVEATALPGDSVPIAMRQPTVTPAPLSVVGTIEPARMVTVVAPFAGLVKEKRFDYGQRVESGQIMLVVDGFDMDMRVRDAEAALLKSAQRLDEATDWLNGTDMARAQRQLAAARREADQAQRRVQDAKPLVEKGIISRQEYEDLQRQAEAQILSRAAAEEELAATVKRGGPDARRMAELEHASAKAKVEDLRRQLERAAVKAPVSGVVMKASAAPSSGASGIMAIEIGGVLSANQSLFMIAPMEELVVAAQVNEMDVNRLRVGQSVEITGDAFPEIPLSGRVAWIAQQATVAEGVVASGVTSASFAVRVDLPILSDVERQLIRVGMSANLTVKTN